MKHKVIKTTKSTPDGPDQVTVTFTNNEAALLMSILGGISVADSSLKVLKSQGENVYPFGNYNFTAQEVKDFHNGTFNKLYAANIVKV